MAEEQLHTPLCPLEFFRLKCAESGSRVSVGNMTRAINSLRDFAGGVELGFDSFNETFLGEWVARQLFDGYQASTVAYNLSKIAALYNKGVESGLAQPTDAFQRVLNRVKTIEPDIDEGAAHKEVFQKLRAIIRTDFTPRPQLQLAKDILLFAVYNGGLTFEQLAAYKKTDYPGADENILEIVNRYSRPKNKYLFPLNQSHSTAKQLSRRIEVLLNTLFAGSGLTLSRCPSLTALDFWCASAMSCGIAASDIAACLAEEHRENGLTAFVIPSVLEPKRKSEIRTQVVATLTHNPLRWYAMHFRRHVDYEMVTARLREKDIFPAEVYYPMEEIIRKVGHKKIFDNRPVISWLMFFRERVTALNRLYSEIGDLAWGYRQSRDVRSPYAVISDRAVRDYQDAIGTLSPDTQMLPDEAVSFNEGDYLIVLGGAFNGRHATFVSERQTGSEAEGKKIVFRVRLAGNHNANWVIDWDPRLVRKITAAQFQELDRLTTA